METYRQQLANRANSAIKSTGCAVVIPTAYKRAEYREFKATATDLYGRVRTRWVCLNFDDSYLDKLLASHGY